jgi:putative addiction module CopG family antidote
MEIHLPEDLQSFVQDQVRAGRFPSEDQVVSESLRRFRKVQEPAASLPWVRKGVRKGVRNRLLTSELDPS